MVYITFFVAKDDLRYSLPAIIKIWPIIIFPYILSLILIQAGDDLYNPMRSPLKNRNQILCEVLGIDS